MIKIFYKDKIVVLTENKIFTNSCCSVSISDYSWKDKLMSFLFLEDCCNTYNIYGDTENVLLNNFKQLFKIVFAAGGVVYNKDNKILFIKRLGWLDLPKGKKENKETNEETAIREVCEECGILKKDLILKEFLKFSYHIYQQDGITNLKETAWFKMNFLNNYELTPQIEEDITEIKWLDNQQINEYKNLLYPALVDLLTPNFL